MCFIARVETGGQGDLYDFSMYSGFVNVRPGAEIFQLDYPY